MNPGLPRLPLLEDLPALLTRRTPEDEFESILMVLTPWGELSRGSWWARSVSLNPRRPQTSSIIPAGFTPCNIRFHARKHHSGGLQHSPHIISDSSTWPKHTKQLLRLGARGAARELGESWQHELQSRDVLQMGPAEWCGHPTVHTLIPRGNFCPLLFVIVDTATEPHLLGLLCLFAGS